MKAPLAVVTMVYNEAEFLPLWLRHYGAQIGLGACHVIDHGSEDGSTTGLPGVNVLRIPRSPQDDDRRARAISDYCASLLAWYDAVISVDVDELLVADPAFSSGLVEFARHWRGEVASATGFDVIHLPDEEPSIDWSHVISGQRPWLRFSSAMCKPVLIRSAQRWVPGFHNIEDRPPVLDAPLFLFHLRYVDLANGLKRLSRTREQPWASENAGLHQRMADTSWEGMLRGMAGLPKRETITLAPHDPALMEWRTRVEQSAIGREHERYRLDLHLSGDELWKLPERFLGRF
ncbi:glycosyltransferase family 2 protein [Acidomonas methanolica]|uniref:glycosyltransferase family 2 protein n=1 Tax=Acidomonas methanolica TaxID=437 RepID=UPI002119D914|nr:glycosyltransferase family 2 protein [Acidomonas methanolica]MCQ9154576.1 glycosyltransferase family 2 protein [Acidomonas methanolica]